MAFFKPRSSREFSVLHQAPVSGTPGSDCIESGMSCAEVGLAYGPISAIHRALQTAMTFSCAIYSFFRFWEYSVELSHPGPRPLHDFTPTHLHATNTRAPQKEPHKTSIQGSAIWTSVEQHHKGGYNFYVPWLYPMHNPLFVAFYDMQVGLSSGVILSPGHFQDPDTHTGERRFRR